MSYRKILNELAQKGFVRLPDSPTIDKRRIAFINLAWGNSYNSGRLVALREFILQHRYPKRVVAVVLDIYDHIQPRPPCGLIDDRRLIAEILADLIIRKYYYKLEPYFFVPAVQGCGQG